MINLKIISDQSWIFVENSRLKLRVKLDSLSLENSRIMLRTRIDKPIRITFIILKFTLKHRKSFKINLFDFTLKNTTFISSKLILSDEKYTLKILNMTPKHVLSNFLFL